MGIRLRWLPPLMLASSDVLLAVLVWLIAYLVQSAWGQGLLSTVATAAVVPSIAVWIGLRSLMGLYPGYGLDLAERLRRHTYSVFATLAVIAVFAIALQVGDLLSRLLIIIATVGLLFLSPLTYSLVRWMMRKLGVWGRPVVVIGYKEISTQTIEILEQEWGLGYNPVAVFDHGLVPSSRPQMEDVHKVVMYQAEEIARRGSVDTVIFALPHTRRENLAPLVNRANLSFRHVLVIPNLNGITNSAATARDLAGTLALEMKYNLLNPWALKTKRALDLLGVVVGALLLAPFLAVVALLIKLDSPGPVLFGHRRLGAGGKHFRCWKFRTMHLNAETLLEEHLQSNPDLRAEWEHTQKLRNDPRATRVGRFLRKTSLDELPQIWNVLCGEMSLVGCRPIVDPEVHKYGETYELYKRVRPGISGWWQVNGRSNTSYDQRVAMDSYYVHNWSVWLDIAILVRTVKIVALGQGAH